YILEKNIDEKYKLVWLVQDPNKFKNIKFKNTKFIQIFPKNILELLELIYYIAVSKFAFYSHRAPFFKLNRGERFINLWHGSPLKNVNFCNLGFNFDFVIYGSEIYKEYYISELKCKENQLLPLGNPRNDFLKNEKKGKVISKLFPEVKYKKNVIWMPTYRKHKNGNNTFKIEIDYKYGVPIIEEKMILQDLDRYLIEREILLIIKLHPAEDISKMELGNVKNIKFLLNEELDENNIQLYSLISETDSLLTDYSSVYVDYLLLNKPIAFTINDMKEYETGFVFKDILKYLPGSHINDYHDLKKYFEDVGNSTDIYTKKRLEVNKLLNKYSDGFSKRIVEEFINL
ncbi:MAG: CDP-glycerol glycerophosphotransferase family protein, partial [Cetobacterium sp.]